MVKNKRKKKYFSNLITLSIEFKQKKIYQECRNSNIVTFYGISEQDNSSCIIMDLLHSSLDDFVTENKFKLKNENLLAL